ncbi:MAG TPA: hypothetical protein VFL85_01450, partial [Candidatus Saccharimonadales bacterium]|nr:hypothetical protein [Candidatus Saccharimonadales bacterium]
MGFAFLAQDEERQRKAQEEYDKLHPSFFDTLKNFPVSAAKAVGRPVVDLATGQGGKFVHDSAQLGADVTGGAANYLLNAAIVNPIKETAASLTGNEEAERNATKKANENLGLGENGDNLAGGAGKFALNSAGALLLAPGVASGAFNALKSGILGKGATVAADAGSTATKSAADIMADTRGLPAGN